MNREYPCPRCQKEGRTGTLAVIKGAKNINNKDVYACDECTYCVNEETFKFLYD